MAPIKLKIRGKIVTGLFGLILALNIIYAISYLLVREQIFRTQSVSMMNMAKTSVDVLERQLSFKITETIEFSHHQEVQRAVLEANRKNQQRTLDERNLIQSIDNQWQYSTSMGSEHRAKILKNSLSKHIQDRFLRQEFLIYGKSLFMEVFITDAAGLVIGASNKTTDYIQIDEEWWLETWKKGSYFQGIGWDESVNGAGLIFAIRIDDRQGRPIGIMKVVLDILEIITNNQILLEQSETGKAKLIDKDGRLLYSTEAFQFLENIADQPVYKKVTNTSGVIRVPENTRRMMYSYIVEKSFLDVDGFSVILLIGEPDLVILKDLIYIRNLFIGLSIIIILIGGGFVYIYLRSIVINPINELHRLMIEWRMGQPPEKNTRARLFNKDDEIGDLASAYQLLMQDIDLKTEQLLESNRQLDQFAYTVSHDLKEPLRGISNYSSFLQSDFGDQLGDKGKYFTDTIVKLSSRLESFIESILYYSRLGRTELTFKQVNINKILPEIIETSHIVNPDQSIKFQTEEDLPTAFCDSVRIKEVFSNLITNGIKYNDKPEIIIEIGSQSSDIPGFVTFFVKDNGIGIPKQQYEKVFQIFKRLHGRDRFGQGSGAGLTIVKKIIERHHGTIWIDSEESEYTVFYFTLPIKPLNEIKSIDPSV